MPSLYSLFLASGLSHWDWSSVSSGHHNYNNHSSSWTAKVNYEVIMEAAVFCQTPMGEIGSKSNKRPGSCRWPPVQDEWLVNAVEGRISFCNSLQKKGGKKRTKWFHNSKCCLVSTISVVLSCRNWVLESTSLLTLAFRIIPSGPTSSSGKPLSTARSRVRSEPFILTPQRRRWASLSGYR